MTSQAPRCCITLRERDGASFLSSEGRSYLLPFYRYFLLNSSISHLLKLVIPNTSKLPMFIPRDCLSIHLHPKVHSQTFLFCQNGQATYRSHHQPRADDAHPHRQNSAQQDRSAKIPPQERLRVSPKSCPRSCSRRNRRVHRHNSFHLHGVRCSPSRLYFVEQYQEGKYRYISQIFHSTGATLYFFGRIVRISSHCVDILPHQWGSVQPRGKSPLHLQTPPNGLHTYHLSI